jgi:hypothetical protein
MMSQADRGSWRCGVARPGGDRADELLGRDPLALLIGMLLDQHLCRRSRDDDRQAFG